ncbi:ferritin-like domain-containing protein [Paenibacillus filicis]|uniref:Ferritin-like domain-containing protein n=1 Tax=Paenibacillus gyeongsangnamensis TaxID=3388067 RepID=A0ABT4QHR8_9BACL|nr:ferritin-like domain-containing protein [Paenibacillus filicis]MCZ8516250.1 ferritin-like domain-containing protein [Paenibacillus filicis]
MYFNSYLRPADSALIADIAKAVNGEYSAIACYEQLAKLAPEEEARKRILEIRNDEIRHFQVTSKIYTGLTGRKPAPHITEPCPSDYRAGLEFAFKDEQETVDFYLNIAEKSVDPYGKDQFRRAAADEQNHAVWFLYLLTRHR